jgi:hypothetical protein
MKLGDFADLTTAQSYIKTVDTKQVGSGQARGYFVNTNKLWLRLRNIQTDLSNPFYSIADTIIATALDAGSYFGMDVNKPDGIANREALALLVSQGILTQTESSGFIAKTLSTTKPFENSTLVQFNQSKGIYTEKEVVDFTQGNDIKITLIDNLTEICMATTWDSHADFEPENFGKITHLKSDVSTYKIKTNNKKADGSLFVRIPLESFNYTVELI